MTTFLELKTALAADLHDTDAKVFTDTDLGAFINKAVAEVSRVAPQQFVEDVTCQADQLSYVLRGGTGNLVANPSFEEGDDTIVGATTAVTVATADSVDLTGGWSINAATAGIYFPKAFALRKTGLYIGYLKPVAAGANVSMYQDIPVNPDTVYIISGWHWKQLTGGLVNRVRVDSYDASMVLVDTSVFQHDTTSAVPVAFSGSYTVPADDTVAFLRIYLMAFGTQPATRETFGFEDISLLEQSEAQLVSSTARTEIEVMRAEIWDSSTEPESMALVIPTKRSAPISSSEGGWSFWGGRFYIPNWVEAQIDPSTQFIRVFGYAPYDRLRTDAQVTDLSDELEFAVLQRAMIEGIRRLVASRALFTQWQTRNNNTDVTVASLMSDLSTHLQEWRSVKRELVVLRER